MARKSKTQKAKASAVRHSKRLEREREESLTSTMDAQGNSDVASTSAEKIQVRSKESESKDLKSATKRADSKSGDAATSSSKKSDSKKAEQQVKKKHFQFLRDVKAELKRVTWPSRQDVLQWSVVVVAALIFFGAFVAILDNLVITPALVGVSSIDVQSDNDEVLEVPKDSSSSSSASSAETASDSTQSPSAETPVASDVASNAEETPVDTATDASVSDESKG